MDSTLTRVMEATGYLIDGKPAASSVGLADQNTEMPWSYRRVRDRTFHPDAWWRGSPDSPSGSDVELKAFFKYVDDIETAPVGDWQREVWNQGFAPLLWVVSPKRVELYNGFGLPKPETDVRSNLIQEFAVEDAELSTLEEIAGRLAMETGKVWEQLPDVNRSTGVDQHLLLQLGTLELKLVAAGLDRVTAQALIGRAIFVQYLVDGRLIEQSELEKITGRQQLNRVFDDREATKSLFGWLRGTFNGDMFDSNSVPRTEFLREIAEFLAGTDPSTGERSLFPYRFDVIPIELISAVYEQFVHSAPDSIEGENVKISAKKRGVFYTPLTVVSLILDEVFDGASGDEHVLDLTCGSGVFLVEALRRLVLLKSNGKPKREIIRQVLYDQIHGVDLSAEAVQIASFSLYLAALELDPAPSLRGEMRFQPLVGNTLLMGNAFSVKLKRSNFDVIVGNPPWTFHGLESKKELQDKSIEWPVQPRGESLDFVHLALSYARPGTRIGMVLSAISFFNKGASSRRVVQSVIEALDRVSLVNLSEFSDSLFPKAKVPAMILIGTGRSHDHNEADVDLVLAHAKWTASGQHTKLIELSPNDITEIPLESCLRNQFMLKAAFLGNRHDLLLLDKVCDRFESLRCRLNDREKGMNSGLILGKLSNRTLDATHLRGLPFVERGIRHFKIPEDLIPFKENAVQRPRQRYIYDAPVLLVGEFLQERSPRLVTAVSLHDIVYTGSYFGIPFEESETDMSYLLAGILASSFVSWFLLMSAKDYGFWVRRVKQSDILEIPIPNLLEVADTEQGRQLIELVRQFHEATLDVNAWSTLDNLVAALYGLDDLERIVVEDGFLRASWQWKDGRMKAISTVTEQELRAYASSFLSTMDSWLVESGKRSMKSKIYSLGSGESIRIIRFILDDSIEEEESVITVLTPFGSLREILARISEKAKTRVSNALVGLIDLRVHADKEVYVIKSAERRNWLRVNAIEDADSVVQDVFDGTLNQ